MFFFVGVACSEENEKTQTAPEYIADLIEQISLFSGAQYKVQYLGGSNEGERIRLTSSVDLFQWVSVTDALAIVPEENRFICGLVGRFALAVKIDFKTEVSEGEVIELVFPKENEFDALNDPTLPIRSLSPSPLLSFIIDQKSHQVRQTYFENRDSETSAPGSWVENVEKMEARSRSLIDEFNRSTPAKMAEMAMSSADNYLRILGISEGWEILFSQDRNWLSWQAAREAVIKASTLEGIASERAKSILSNYQVQ